MMLGSGFGVLVQGGILSMIDIAVARRPAAVDNILV